MDADPRQGSLLPFAMSIPTVSAAPVAATDTPAMTRRNFFVGDRMWQALRAKAEASDTPIAEHVRAAIAQYLSIPAAEANT
jgi:hypothetical protein